MGACHLVELDLCTNTERSTFFRDQHGRSLILHGVNVSGSCKLPNGPIPECLDPAKDEFWNIRYGFVNRPFPLADAEQHFTRLRSYGLSLIRLVVTWEAVEPQPDVYDLEFLEYLRSLLQIASDQGLLIVLDFHQDCWSRFTGGSGAPLWTFEVAGLIPRNFEKCGASILQKADLKTHAEAGTLWATNYTKFAVNTMFTLFFGGEVFAPRTMIHGENIGSYLRRHYFKSIATVLHSVKDVAGVIGIDPMNEPHHGFIGLDTLDRFDENVLLHLKDMPSALQSMRLAAGIPQYVAHYTKSWPKPTRATSQRLLNSEKVSAWKDKTQDIWATHGVYSATSSIDRYFAEFPAEHARAGQKVDFSAHFYVPFLQEIQRIVKEVSPRLFTFVEPIPNTLSNPLTFLTNTRQTCYAPHWYDLQVLFEKRFSTRMTMNVQALSRGSRNLLAHTYFGYNQTINNYAKQYASIFADAFPTVPRLVGETGIPFDMNFHYTRSTRRGYSEDYSTQRDMMDIMCSAMERNLLSYTLWNYTPENRAYSGGGDLWNGEDFSIYCASEVPHTKEMLPQYAGTRAASAWIRPNAVKIAGHPLQSEFDLRRGTYTLSFVPSAGIAQMSRQTEIFLPNIHLNPHTQSISVTFSGIEASWHHDLAEQTLYFVHEHSEAGINEKPDVCKIVIDFGTFHGGMGTIPLLFICMIFLVAAVFFSTYMVQ